MNALAWFEPASSSDQDKAAAERQQEFAMGWFANPIFSETGDYPAMMKDIIGRKSIEEGRTTSRLPEFTDGEIEMLKGIDYVLLYFV